jgi:hypothetical protein
MEVMEARPLGSKRRDVSIRDRLELEGTGVSKRVGANVAPERRMRRWKGLAGDGTGHPTEALK